MAEQGRFTNMGGSLYKIANKMLENQTLCKLVKFTGNDPLAQPDIEDTSALLHDNFIIKPRIPDTLEDKGAVITILFQNFSKDPKNESFKFLELHFIVLMSPEQWMVNGTAPRPFLIMQELDKMFNTKKLEGLGNLNFATANFITPTTSYSGYDLVYVYNDFD